MNSTTRKFLSFAFITIFVLTAALSMGMSGTDNMADEPGIKTVVFGVT